MSAAIVTCSHDNAKRLGGLKSEQTGTQPLWRMVMASLDILGWLGFQRWDAHRYVSYISYANGRIKASWADECPAIPPGIRRIGWSFLEVPGLVVARGPSTDIVQKTGTTSRDCANGRRGLMVALGLTADTVPTRQAGHWVCSGRVWFLKYYGQCRSWASAEPSESSQGSHFSAHLCREGCGITQPSHRLSRVFT